MGKLLVVSMAAVAALGGASAAHAQRGSVTQLAGLAACASEDGGAGQCSDALALERVRHLAISPDGRHLYATGGALFEGFLAAFARDPRSGAIAQLPGDQACIAEAENPPTGVCVAGRGLLEPAGIAVAPDGRHVYVAAPGRWAVAAFARELPSGALRQLDGTSGCVSADPFAGECAVGRGLTIASDVAMSPDGRNVYVSASVNSAVAAFDRDATTGVLTQLEGTDGCVAMPGAPGGCAAGTGLEGASRVVVSRDGRHVYVLSFHPASAVAVFSRDRRTGALTQLPGRDACWSATGTDGACHVATAFFQPRDLALAPDGRSLYVVTTGSNSLVAFQRSMTTGALLQLPLPAGCISNDGSDGVGTGGTCADGVALDAPSAVTVSRDGRNVYVASLMSSALAAFARDPRTGLLTQLPNEAACTSRDGTGGACASGTGLGGATAVAISRDGRNVYVGGMFDSAIAAFARRRKGH